MNTFHCIADDVALGNNVRLSQFINLYGCWVGDETKIGAFVEIQKNARVGKRCKISSHTFICEGVVIEDNVFIGHGVTFTNDRYPRSTAADGQLQTEMDWIVGAGSVFTRDVPANSIVAGNPARVLRYLEVIVEGQHAECS